MAPAGVELEMLVSEPDALTTRPMSIQLSQRQKLLCKRGKQAF